MLSITCRRSVRPLKLMRTLYGKTPRKIYYKILLRVHDEMYVKGSMRVP
jgi:hypothetical protein